MAIQETKKKFSPRERKNWQLKLKFGITYEDYERMLEAQNGECAICHMPQGVGKRALAVDHDHRTGKVRALLCGNCNRGIGHLQDNADLCEAAALYLRNHS